MPLSRPLRHPMASLVPALALLIGAVAVPTAAQEAGSARADAIGAARRVTVIVERLRSDRGRVIGGLYAEADQWLREDHATADCRATIQRGTARCVFDGVPPGRVAFAAMHDEDADGQMDRDLVGIPSEGYAFSNDVREPFGPPSFGAASFVSDVLRVHARYGI
jgi:uncharacterized protein (DUF2141 family)